MEDILAYDFEALDKYMKDLSLEKDIVYSVIESNDGKNITSYLHYEDPLIQKAVASSGNRELLKVIKHINREFNVHPLEFSIRFNNQVYGKLLIGLNKTRIYKRGQNNLYAFIIYAVGIGFLLSITIYLVFTLQVVRPLKRLLFGFKKVGEGDIEYKVPVYSENEFSVLTNSFNEMVLSLKQYIEQTIKLKEEAEEANSAKTDFLSRMSHELRTPLNAILGYGQLLEVENLTNEQKDSVEQILFGGRHLLSLVEDILDITKIREDMLKFAPEPVNIFEIVEECWLLSAHQAKEKNIKFNILNSDDAREYNILADPQRIKQVINLIGNAIKYNCENGKVNVSFKPLDNDLLRTSVTNNGPGIPENRIEDIFSPFERLNAKNTSVDGLGLGLTLTKMLVEKMGGDIGVSSKLNDETTFYVDMPSTSASLVTSTNPESNVEKIISSNNLQYNILYIEDNLQNFNLIKRVLAKNININLSHADTGLKGIEQAENDKPDLILLDMRLPDIDGADVFSQIKLKQDLQDIPVIVLSANASDDNIKEMLAMGVYDYLTKPINVSVFNSIVNELIRIKESHKALSQA